MAVNPLLNQDPAYAAATAANEAARNAATLISTGSMQGYDLTKPSDYQGVIASSQWWMTDAFKDSGQADPTLATKAIYSDASYARDWASEYAKAISALGVPVSPKIGAIAGGYPEASQNTLDLWAKNSIASPLSAVKATLATVGIKFNTPTNSPGSTNEPSYVTQGNPNNPTSTENPNGDNPTTSPTTPGGGGSPLDAVTGAIGSYGIWILGGLIFVALAFLMFRRGSARPRGYGDTL